jgi:hypothetical protein
MPITGTAACGERVNSGQAAADPATSLIRSRRRIAFPNAKDRTIEVLQQEFVTCEMGLTDEFALQKILSRKCRNES